MTTPETMTDAIEFDEAKAEAFSDGFVAALNASSIAPPTRRPDASASR